MSEKPIEFYKLEKVVIEPSTRENPRIATAALRWCDLCGVTIDSMGGPGAGSLCMQCGDAVKRGQLRGQLVWENDEAPA